MGGVRNGNGAGPRASADARLRPRQEEADPQPRAQAPDAGDLHSTKTVEFEAFSPGASSAPAPGPSPAPEPDAAVLRRLEAQLIARRRWRELARLYLERADRARQPAERAEALARLAELMENELSDPAGAARMYAEIVALTGDRAALKEQLRLLALREDPSLVQRALDDAVKRASSPHARAAALLTRAEHALAHAQPARAREDLEATAALLPGSLPVLAGLLRCAPMAQRPALAERLRSLLASSSRRAPERLEALRTLASQAEQPLRQPRLAQWAWAELLAEAPEEVHARERLLVLARELGDSAELARLLRERLAREPRGPKARQDRLELVATLEAQGDSEGALAELRMAVRMEPGHKQAWLLLVERCQQRGLLEEAAWALEHAATAMEDEVERMHGWMRLAVLCRDALKDFARAQVFAQRAENMRRAMLERGVPLTPPPPALAPRAPEPPVALRRVRERPLEAGPYRLLAEAFQARGHAARAALMAEVADALEGRPGPPPPEPSLRLTSQERVGLRHPELRTPVGELLACIGPALCRLFPTYGPSAGTGVSVCPELGPGAAAALEALRVASHVLGLALPELILSDEEGPPLSLVHASAPRLLLGRLAVRQPVDAAALRFHAGSALFGLDPDLLALRGLKKDQLLRGLSLLSAVLHPGEHEAPGPEARLLRDSLTPSALQRAARLLEEVGPRRLDVPSLAEAARHSAWRAGLLVCGALGPALAVLRARRTPEPEVVELVRFAGSERYLQLRAPPA